MEITPDTLKAVLEENLSDINALVDLLMKLKESPDVQKVVSAIPKLTATFKPLLDGLRQFAVQQDIDSIIQFEKAGLTKEQAIMLIARHSGITGVLLSGTAGQINNRRGK